MLVFGKGEDTIVLSSHGEEYCPTCEKERPFHTVLVFEFFHFYYVFRHVLKEKYSKVCEICGRGTTLDPAVVRQEIGGSPLSVFQRFGCLLWFAAMGILIVGFIILGKKLRGEL